MASSIASTSRMGAFLMNQAHSITESLCGRGIVASSTSRPTRQVKSARAAGKQRKVRHFSTGIVKCSAWAAGQDADNSGTLSKGNGSAEQHHFFPSIERSVTVGSIAELKARGEPV